jgi:hypothetical protein
MQAPCLAQDLALSSVSWFAFCSAANTFSLFSLEIVGRTNCLLSFDMTWTAEQTKKLGGIDRQQGDLISHCLLLSNWEKVG